MYVFLVGENISSSERSSIETSLYNRYVVPVVNFSINFKDATITSTSNLLSWIENQNLTRLL